MVELTGFVFGIRMVKSFSIEDKLGAIVDDILYSEQSEFSDKIFTEVNSNSITKILTNRNTGDKLTISAQDIIFEYAINKDFEIEFDKYLKNFSQFILKKIFKTYDIKNIHRFGFVIKSELSKNDELLDEIATIIKKKHKGDDESLALRFNVINKKPLKIKEVITEDYDNQIITYDKLNNKSPLVLSIDYQKYFNPELTVIDDATMTFDTFCKNSFQSFKNQYLISEKK